MEITLKNLRVAQNLSEETLAFTATIYVDGKRAGDVSNRGNGGSCIWAFNDRALGQRVEEWAAALPAVPADVAGEYGPIPMDLDLYVHGLACRMNRERILRRLCRTRTVGRMADDPPGEIREWDAPYTPFFAAKLRAHFGPQLAEIINERFI